MPRNARVGERLGFTELGHGETVRTPLELQTAELGHPMRLRVGHHLDAVLGGEHHQLVQIPLEDSAIDYERGGGDRLQRTAISR